MKPFMRTIGALLICFLAGALVDREQSASAVSNSTASNSNSWDPKAAAAYLDYRAGWWMEWKGSARDHGTVCVSCHTGLPYVLARPALRSALAEQGPSVNERRLIDDVIKRVRLGGEVGPYYGDEGYNHKTAESRGTEAVLNALILASYDSQDGDGQLRDDTRAAFANMWALQQTAGDKKGAWSWLQFDLEPWEASDSVYYGATLAAIAVGTAPGNYASSAEIENNLTLLREYLKRESAAQSTISRVFLLWASTKLPGLLTPEGQQAIIAEIMSKQQADGGWRLASVAWSWKSSGLWPLVNMWVRADETPLDGKSDGVATSLVTLALQEAGMAHDNVQLKRGLLWLMSNQNSKEGFWAAPSLNKRRSQSSDTGRFMSDAATAYAVLALTESERAPKPVASALSH